MKPARATATTGIPGAVTAAAAAGMAAAGGWDSCFKSPWEEAGGGPARKAFAAAQLVSSLAGGWGAGTRGGGGEKGSETKMPLASLGSQLQGKVSVCWRVMSENKLLFYEI